MEKLRVIGQEGRGIRRDLVSAGEKIEEQTETGKEHCGTVI